MLACAGTSLTLKGKPSLISPCAAAIRFKSTSAAGNSTWANWAGGSPAASTAEIRHNDFLLRFLVPPYEMTVFADGRAIIKGTKDPAVARSLYARYVGS